MFQDIRRGINKSDLGILIQEEKDVIKSMQRVVKEQAEASKYLAVYGEKETSPDIIDVTGKLWVVLDCIGGAMGECGRRFEVHRELLKDIKVADDALATLKTTEKALAEKLKDALKKKRDVEHFTKMHAECHQRVMEMESNVACDKRRLLKQAVHVKMDAIIEMSAKLSIAASYGKHLADQLPQGKLSPGQQMVRHAFTIIKSDCLTALKDWKHPNPNTFDVGGSRRMSLESISSLTAASFTHLNLSTAPIKPTLDTQTRRESYQHHTTPIEIPSTTQNTNKFVIRPSSFSSPPRVDKLKLDTSMLVNPQNQDYDKDRDVCNDTQSFYNGNRGSLSNASLTYLPQQSPHPSLSSQFSFNQYQDSASLNQHSTNNNTNTNYDALNARQQTNVNMNMNHGYLPTTMSNGYGNEVAYSEVSYGAQALPMRPSKPASVRSNNGVNGGNNGVNNGNGGGVNNGVNGNGGSSGVNGGGLSSDVEMKARLDALRKPH